MYGGVRKIFARYWRAYGGTHALVRSPYFHLSLVLLLLTAHFWITNNWWLQPISVLPNLLGFSLGGLAMFLSFGDERFRAILTEDDTEAGPNQVSPYMEIAATFVHFILLQLGALLIAVVANSLDFVYDWPNSMETLVRVLTTVFGAIGYLLFLYSLCAMLAATMAVFRMCHLYEVHQKNRGSG